MRLTLVVLAVVVALGLVPVAVAVAPPDPDFGALIRDIGRLGVDNSQPLLASAEASERAFMRGNCNAALGALGALENKLDARGNAPPDPDSEAFRAVRGDIAQIRAGLQAPPEPELPPGPC